MSGQARSRYSSPACRIYHPIIMTTLEKQLRDTVFTDFTQCVMCGERDAFLLSPELNHFVASRPKIVLSCSRCCHEEFFDVNALIEKLGVDHFQFVEMFED